MDHNVVQRLLDHANTRGTAIVARTIKEMIRDRKTIMVAFVSLLSIMIGVTWSQILSDDQDIQEVRVQEVPNTADIFVDLEVPVYLPNKGNYTFDGRIYNRGDTVQKISINMTLGNSKSSNAGVPISTGLMNVTPYYDEGIGDYSAEPHYFSITYNMDDFKEGTTFFVIQMYVKNSVSSISLLPEDFDFYNFDFTQFDIEDLIGNNDAVYSHSIRIQEYSRWDVDYEFTNDLHISRNTSIMPLTVTVPSHIVPTVNNSINCSIEQPLNGSSIEILLVSATTDYLEQGYERFSERYTHSFAGEVDQHNFSIELHEDFAPRSWDFRFYMYYWITPRNQGTYERFAIFSMDLVKEEFGIDPEYHEVILSKDTLYQADFEYPTDIVSDHLNTFTVHMENYDLDSQKMTANIGMHCYVKNEGWLWYNISRTYTVASGGEVTDEIIFEKTIEEIFENLSSTFPLVEFTFWVTADELDSPTTTTDQLYYDSYLDIVGKTTETLSDTFTPSLDAYLFIPEDLSKTKDSYRLRGTVNNTGVIDKEFWVIVTLQNHEYSSDVFIVQKGEGAEFFVEIEMDNHTKGFEEDIKMEVFSTRTTESDIPEAETIHLVNIISETHKERKAVEHFLYVYIQLYIWFIVPLVTMTYGISLISDESERKTLGLYLTTPITNLELILYKFGGYLVAMTIILTIPLILIYLSFVYVLPLSLIVYYLLLLGVCIFGLFLAIAGYGAVFTMIGTFEKRPVFIGISYLMVWEIFMGTLGIFLTRYTIFYHIRNAMYPLVSRFVADARGDMLLNDLSGNDFTMSMEYSMIAIVLVVFIFLFLSIRNLTYRDVN